MTTDLPFIIKLSMIGLMLCMTYVNSFSQQQGICCHEDIQRIQTLNHQAEFCLGATSVEPMNQKKILARYSKIFGSESILCMDIFSLGENASAIFCQTSLDNPKRNDSGLATWKLIIALTEKLSDQWVSSGWRRLGSDGIYFIRLEPSHSKNQFQEIVFFTLNSKLSFALFQCPMSNKTLIEKIENQFWVASKESGHKARYLSQLNP